jgi:hypothetical protein
MDLTRFKYFLPCSEKTGKTVKTFLTQATLAHACDSGSGHGAMALTGSAAAAVADRWSPPVRSKNGSKSVSFA